MAIAKGEQTKEMILERSAQLFSTQGYFGLSLNDIMRETGLKKGGIYNHFSSKDQLALEAFDYSVELVGRRMRAALATTGNSAQRLLAILTVFRDLVENPVLDGGCPVLNTAIEADDAHPQLRERARKAMDEWRASICHITRRGIEKGEIKPDVDEDTLATIMISMLEGAIMMSKLYGDNSHILKAVAHLTRYIETTIKL